VIIVGAFMPIVGPIGAPELVLSMLAALALALAIAVAVAVAVVVGTVISERRRT
jgi:hypothetical protein